MSLFASSTAQTWNRSLANLVKNSPVVLNTLALEITACTLATFGFRLPWDLLGRKLSLSSEQRKVALYPRESIQPAKRHLPQLLEFRTKRIRLPWASVIAALA